MKITKLTSRAKPSEPENNLYGAAEPAADPEKPEPEVKGRLNEGSTLPTEPEPPTGSDGKATEDIPSALSRLMRNPSVGVVLDAGMTGAGGRRRGRYHRPLLEDLDERRPYVSLIILRIVPSGHGIHYGLTRTIGRRQPIPEQTRHTRTSVIVDRARKFLRPLPILYGTLQSMASLGVADDGLLAHEAPLQRRHSPEGQKTHNRGRNTGEGGTHIHQISHQMRTQSIHGTTVHPEPGSGRYHLSHSATYKVDVIWMVGTEWPRTRSSIVAPCEEEIMRIVLNWRPGRWLGGVIPGGAVNGDDLGCHHAWGRKNGTRLYSVQGRLHHGGSVARDAARRSGGGVAQAVAGRGDGRWRCVALVATAGCGSVVRWLQDGAAAWRAALAAGAGGGVMAFGDNGGRV
nr:hypothetical protein Iba_chr13cCG12630 [Ipomoea batatas]